MAAQMQKPNFAVIKQKFTWLKGPLHGAWAGVIGGAYGGAIFGIFTMVAEQVDRSLADFDLGQLLLGAPLFALLGALIGAPVGLVCGVLLGIAANRLFAWPQARRVGILSGTLIGMLIGGSLQGVQISGDWDKIVAGWLLTGMGALCGSIAGRCSGTLFARYAP